MPELTRWVYGVQISEEVLIIDCKGKISICEWVDNKYWYRVENSSFITHWMPLPEPPKE